MAKSVSDSTVQHARIIEMARDLGCDESEAAIDEKLKAVLNSSTSTDVEVLDALGKGLELGNAHVERSRKALCDSKKALIEANWALQESASSAD